MAEPRTDATTCCVVGAGPAGVLLAWLLSRAGVSVTLLERHRDFERDFRGDTLHPGILEMLEQLGLAERVLALPHSRMQSLAFHTPRGSLTVADLRTLRTRFPFVAMLPQARFLKELVDSASESSEFRLVMGADVRELIRDGEVVRGVRYVDAEQQSHEVRAKLVVAADGRGSRLRKLVNAQAIRSAPEIDVLWFRIPRREGQQGGGYLGAGGYMIVLQRQEEWQIGFVILKGRHAELRAAGMDALRESIVGLAPNLADSVATLDSWSQVRLLSVQADRLRQWHRPGLLFLGDAAHVMSPVGGVGINYAMQDALEAAVQLVEPLGGESVSRNQLRSVQRARQLPTRLVQSLQAFDQKWLIQPALLTESSYRFPLWFRLAFGLPVVRRLPTRLFAFGWNRIRIPDGLLDRIGVRR